MASIREATALAILYRACGDPMIRARAAELVPEIDDVVPILSTIVGDPVDDGVRGFELTAWDSSKRKIGERTVVGRPSDIATHEAVFAREFPYADVSITSRVVVEHHR